MRQMAMDSSLQILNRNLHVLMREFMKEEKKTWEELEGPDLEKRSDLSECPKEIESSVDVDRVFH